MDVNITKAFHEICGCAMDYSASRAELGDDAGHSTWRNACADAGALDLLTTRDELQAFARFARASGGWNDAEIAKWSVRETRALFLQWIAGDMREGGLNCESPDWSAYEDGCKAGQFASNIFRADDGTIYFSLDA